MTTATRTLNYCIPVNTLRRGLPIVLAVAAFAAVTPRAHAAQLDQLVVEPPVVKVIGRDSIDAPVEQVTVVARVIPDPETLTTDSGIALLKDYVYEAARKACFEADPMVPDDGTCVRNAVKSAQPQVAALIAHAKSTTSG